MLQKKGSKNEAAVADVVAAVVVAAVVAATHDKKRKAGICKQSHKLEQKLLSENAKEVPKFHSKVQKGTLKNILKHLSVIPGMSDCWFKSYFMVLRDSILKLFISSWTAYLLIVQA